MIGFIRRPAVAFALGAALAAAAFVGKSAFGASGGGVIHACFKPSNGTLYLVGASSRATCQPGDSPIDWNAEGPPGAQGPAGPAGPAGAAGTSIVNSPLAAGDAHCPYGGSAFSGAGGTTYACNGAPGRDGVPTNELVSPNGEYRIVAGNDSIRIESLVTGTNIQLQHLGITLHGAGSVAVESAGDLNLRAGTALRAQSSGTADLRAGATLTLNGSLIGLNGSCAGVVTGSPLVVQTPVTIGPDGGGGIFPSLPILGSPTVRSC